MSCKIWACVNTKGGTGKTTLTAILASEIIRLGGSVALVDTDPNQPLENWQNKFPKESRLPVLLDDDPDGATLADTIERATELADFVLVDTEGSENMRMARLPRFVDLILLPMQYSELDRQEVEKVEAYLQTLDERIDEPIPRIVVPTRVSAAIRTKTEKQLRSSLTQADIPVLDPPILDKDAFKQMFTQGKLLQDLPSSSGIKSAQENARAAFEGLAKTYSALKAQHREDQTVDA
ncbi:ParA family protein [Cognatishimia sp. D5M38]|uniref:ParA family protein n=1 Tax=Cognatishimia coralii TaxID=3083254 RepID=A0ABU8QL68_9RHOB